MDPHNEPEDIVFSGPTESTRPQMAVRRNWWAANADRIAGAMRIVAHLCLTGSGLGLLGVPFSGLRMTAGILGVAGASFLALFGGSSASREQTPDAAERLEQARPVSVPRVYFGLLTSSALALTFSGLLNGNPTEFAAGAWTATWCGYSALMPEGEANADAKREFNSAIERKIDEYQRNPKKFGSDMLQANSAIALADGFWRQDPLRFISGICLGLSNMAGRYLRDKPTSPPER